MENPSKQAQAELEPEIRIKISRIILAKPWQVFRRILRIEDFPQYMPNVKESRILGRVDHKVKAQWTVLIEDIPIRWVEEQDIDRRQFTIAFRALEGDLEKFDGRWAFKSDPKGTLVELEVAAKIGIPVIEQLVGPVLKEKITRNFILMLDAINNRIVAERYDRFRRGESQKIGGFAIIGHPYNLNNLIRYLQFLKPQFKAPSREFLSRLYELVPSYVMYDVQNLTSAAGVKSHGLVVVSTFIPDMLTMDVERVFNKVVEACRVAEAHHIGIAALGGFTSIAGERFGEELQKRVNIPLTTGNTFTVALALDGVKKACELMGIDLTRAKICVVGGTGDIGGACARILAEGTKEVTVTGRRPESVKETVDQLKKVRKAKIRGTINNQEAIQDADVVIAAASVTNSIIDINSFKPGAVICDLAYPKNISYVPSPRKDILVFSGGLSEIPADINLGFEIGLPSSRSLYGCFAEAILLDLERRYESFSYGKGHITNDKVEEIRKIGNRHGFKVSPFFWGDRLLEEGEISLIRENARGI